MKQLRIAALALGLAFLAQTAQAGWTAAKRLTWNAGSSENPAVAVDSAGQVHVVWWDSTPGHYEIYYTRSTDGGTSWQPSKRLTWTDGSLSPAIAVDGLGRLHVVWVNNLDVNSEIYYKRSTDGGVTWGANKRLTWTSGQSLMPAVAVDSSGYLHVAWQDNTNAGYEVYYKRSSDGGTTWTPNRRLTWTSGSSDLGDLAVDTSGNPHLVWNATPAVGYDELYYRKGIDGGLNWTTTQRLTWNAGYSAWSSITCESSGHVQVVWEDYTPGNTEIFYKRSPNLGISWGTSQRLSWNSAQSRFPDIAADPDGLLHVVWEDDSSGNFEIYYRKSPDNGTSWSAVQRLTWTSNWCQNPEIAADSSGNLHLVWSYSPSGNTEIYYKKYVK
jgi:BNR repeat-like domain